MKTLRAGLAVALAFVLLPFQLDAADAASPAAEPVLEPSTTTCLGVYWIVRGDDDGDAHVATAWRVAGAPEWTPGADLFRVVKGHHKAPKGPSLDIPDDARLFAGSVLWLKPGTDYDLRLSLADPDGGAAEKILHARTAVEPIAATDAPIRHVAPGDGGGTGTTDDPFKGLTAAHAAAKPGDIMLLHAGVYGPLPITVSGEPGKPIVWRGADDGEAIIDGGGIRRVIEAVGVHDVWFENLTVRNGERGIAFHESQRIVVRRCHLYKLIYPIAATVDQGSVGFFICDNLIEGPCVWPRTDAKGIEAERGIQVVGEGHEICYNRVHGFADAIDTFQEGRCSAIDIHHNDVSELTDDGLELDYSQRNVRCWANRLTNAYQGISLQPIYGGPVYVLRNTMVNVVGEPFKLHNTPSGAILAHNTIYKKGMPLGVFCPAPIRNFTTRNNLFIGLGEARYALGFDTPMEGCDFDYDGFIGGPWANFAKWNNVKYSTVEKLRESCPVYHHAEVIDLGACFAVPPTPITDDTHESAIGDDFRLAPTSPAVDAGSPLPGLDDGFAGKAPDLGAFELGDAIPAYGPRPK